MQIRHIAVITSFVVFLCSQTFGQARVVEAGGGANNTPAQAGANNDLLISLYNQLEALQQEVQTLRGLMEEQGNQIRRMQTEQRDRYLDIDSRLNEIGTTAPLTGGASGAAAVSAVFPAANQPPVGQSAGNPVVTTPSPALPDDGVSPSVSPSPSATVTNSPTAVTSSNTTGIVSQQSAPVPNTAVANSTTTVVGAASGSPQDEQELYRNALKLLVEENKHEEAIQMFQTYIDLYPRGRLLTNTLYWQGEAYLLASGYPQAEAVFNRLLTEYPQDPKAAGALLKLGMVYKGAGDTARAQQVWRELPSRYPESANEIRLAREYLQSL